MEAAKTKLQSKEVAYCRHCYDHLAGEVGVKVTDALIIMGVLERGRRSFTITKKGKEWFKTIGISVEIQKAKKRQFARQCLDWTERRHHLAGAMGASLLAYFIAAKWLKPKSNSRAFCITNLGKEMFENELGICV